MYTVYNKLAPFYLHEFVQLRNINLDNKTSTLWSVAHKSY